MSQKWNRKQQKAIELLASNEYESLDGLCSVINTSHTTLRRWRRNPDFAEAVIARARALLKEKLPEIYESAANKATSGDYHHVKIILEHLDKLEEMKHKANEGNLSFTWKIPDTDVQKNEDRKDNEPE